VTSHSADTVESDRPPAGKIAIVSDVHGNLPAFRAVTEDIESEDVDETWCLGDLVGYGAQPDECVALARETCALTLAGNHDLVVIDRLPIAEFSSAAAAAAEWTRGHASEETLEFLRGLEPLDTGKAIGLFHASPRDPIWEYVLSSWQAEECIEEMEARVGAVGHSHVALFFHVNGSDEVKGAQVPGGTELDISEGRWLINPGGVGQPRDGDPRAAWLLLDTDNWTAAWRRVEYPIDEAAAAIEAAGLPPVLANRLYAGQ
jgi:diadenosine tetraphosphatase ApaH/serine/threonine PP2A family protein phosphatase